MFLYVIAYDIPCDKRRTQISNLLEGYGKRVQYSVFECVLTESKFKELTQLLKRKYQSSEDSIRFYPISTHTFGQIQTWGGPDVTKVTGSIII